jgi:hypothetical protein
MQRRSQYRPGDTAEYDKPGCVRYDAKTDCVCRGSHREQHRDVLASVLNGRLHQ